MRRVSRAVAAFLVFTVGTVMAGRPLTVDDADPVEPGKFEFEAGTVYEREPSCREWEFPFGLTAGIFPNVEAGVGIGGLFQKCKEDGETNHESGLSDLSVGTKWQILKEAGWLPRQALAFSVKFPSADEYKGLGSGKTDYDLTWIASKALTDAVGLHLNAGHTWIGDPDGEDTGDVVHSGVALDYQLTETIRWVGEIFAERELQDGTQTIAQLNTGFRWNPSECLTFDCAAGPRLYGDDAPDLTATLGLTWAFDL